MTEHERLVELIDSADIQINGNVTPYRDYGIDDLATHLLANGVIVPPCKVGDKVWNRFCQQFEIVRIEVLKDTYLFVCGNQGTDDYMSFYESEIGIRTFFTKEETEKILKGSVE